MQHNIYLLKVLAKVRSWEDAIINDVPDTSGDLTPCRIGDAWAPEIEVDTGVIMNWEAGKTADIYFKVCDGGVYKLIDTNGNVVVEKEGYVPSLLSIGDKGYGDYIILNVDSDGKIQNWKPDLSSFHEES